MTFRDKQVSNSEIIHNHPLNAASVVSCSPKPKEPKILGKWVVWQEQRTNDSGRTTVLARPWGQLGVTPQELTPSPWNIRSRVHGYGGGALAAACYLDRLLLVWVEDSTGCLWSQIWEGINDISPFNDSQLIPINEPLCISKKDQSFFGDGLIDLKRMLWLGLMEREGRDYLVTLSLEKEFQNPRIIYEALGFLGYPKLSPDNMQLAWVEWKEPFMPWDQSDLMAASLSKSGDFNLIKSLIKSSSSNPLSVFQPIWLDNYHLLVSDDSNGWWNLKLLKVDIINELIEKYKKTWDVKAETAMPQWVAGMSTISCSDGLILALSCKESQWNLNFMQPNGTVEKINLPFDDLAYLDVNQGRGVMVASNSFQEPIILEVDLTNKNWNHQLKSRPIALVDNQISVGESIWFKGYNSKLTHAWFYPPSREISEKKPLLLKIHSGPTAMASRGLNLSIQFWTSRGWSVLDVNYGGSTGFGRCYRDRLKAEWGRTDVFDCYLATMELIRLGKVDKEYIAIEGSSAGGFTALSCLSLFPIFKAASCKYPVSDLLAMQKSTHRFEENYLDYLLGTFSVNNKEYKSRSPINNIDQINSPVIIFHGLEDKVIQLDQITNFSLKLKRKSVPVELHTFPNEGHGFKEASSNIKVLTLTEKFFVNHLGI
ncbi:alpha/beta hydrolase family protein [Prochlorococcus marinus]|uniref:alpha/beta hydrolase family protein n=1 Tax=Prochlorococcus marinus TaxID=1219 RepID=UPI0022B37EC9|nr:prolyl oligopeptidase family serine peptidase [Prochlorococcus marinus]